MMGAYAQSEVGMVGELRSSTVNGISVFMLFWDLGCGFIRQKVSSHLEH